MKEKDSNFYQNIDRKSINLKCFARFFFLFNILRLTSVEDIECVTHFLLYG